MVRTQLYLDEAIHSKLVEVARKQKRTISDLVRDALSRAYGTAGPDERLRTLRTIEGLWRDRTDIGTTGEYVRRLRQDTHRKRTRKR